MARPLAISSQRSRFIDRQYFLLERFDDYYSMFTQSSINVFLARPEANPGFYRLDPTMARMWRAFGIVKLK
jgi:hypothetical protein